MIVRSEGTLNLTEGDYYFTTLRVGPKGVINVTVDDQVTAINVIRDIRFSSDARVEVLPYGTSGSRFVSINSLRGDIQLAGNTSVSGSLIAPSGLVRVGRGSFYKGAICAESILVESETTLLSHTSEPLAPSAPLSQQADQEGSFILSEKENDLPEKIDLAQNYPNPFNPTTTIQFSLPESQHVRLGVYDMLGREVALLVDDVINAGVHNVLFDASSLSNGTYLYRLEANEMSLTGHMTLIK